MVRELPAADVRGHIVHSGDVCSADGSGSGRVTSGVSLPRIEKV
ncbi:hypothetical protein SANTM175S_08990 [Streptomyces antimycoticus]